MTMKTSMTRAYIRTVRQSRSDIGMAIWVSIQVCGMGRKEQRGAQMPLTALSRRQHRHLFGCCELHRQQRENNNPAV